MQRRRRTGPLELGVVLLLYEIFHAGLNNIPPITLIAIAYQAALYIGYIQVPWQKHEVCISAVTVLKKSEWRRMVLSSLEHGDDMHLYYNMTSFLVKGKTLEKKYGSTNFALLLAIIMLLTNVMYIVVGQTVSEITDSGYYQNSCAIGFSGVIFALKVLTTFEDPSIRSYVWGITMPGKYAAWLELIVIHYLVPNSSFIGHFSGIMAGVIYCHTLIGSIIDRFVSTISGVPMLHGEFNYADLYS